MEKSRINNFNNIDETKLKNTGSLLLQKYINYYKLSRHMRHASINLNYNLLNYLDWLTLHSSQMYNDDKKKREIVVARYNEDLNWCSKMIKLITVYNKGKTIKFIDSYQKIPKNIIDTPLHNIGRESHTYLYHIINNWDNLSDITLFTQGNLSYEHHPYPVSLYLLAKNQDITINLFQKGIELDHNKRFIHTGKYNYNLRNGKMRPAKLNFIDWWKKFIYFPFPGEKNILWSHGAIFSITKELIKSNPKEYYQKLITCIDDHPDPEEGHYFERAWFYIFNKGIIKNL